MLIALLRGRLFCSLNHKHFNGSISGDKFEAKLLRQISPQGFLPLLVKIACGLGPIQSEVVSSSQACLVEHWFSVSPDLQILSK